MENLKNLFDAFYDRLVLRDFFGKIIPGLMLLSTIYFCLPSQLNNVPKLDYIQNISSLGWIAISGLAWLLTFSVQSFGESIGVKKKLIIYYPKDKFSDDEKFFEFKIKFNEVAFQDEKSQNERFVVIKEACGNGYVTILISGVLVILYLLAEYMQSKEELLKTILKDNWPMLLFTVFVLFYLQRMHYIHVDRQYKHMKRVVDRYDERKKSMNNKTINST
jgi:hypothetical protein